MGSKYFCFCSTVVACSHYSTHTPLAIAHVARSTFRWFASLSAWLKLLLFHFVRQFFGLFLPFYRFAGVTDGRTHTRHRNTEKSTCLHNILNHINILNCLIFISVSVDCINFSRKIQIHLWNSWYTYAFGTHRMDDWFIFNEKNMLMLRVWTIVYFGVKRGVCIQVQTHYSRLYTSCDTFIRFFSLFLHHNNVCN